MAQDDREGRIRRAQLAREEARATIDEQTTTLADIDEKAIQIFRVNLILAGVLVSGVSIAVQSDNASTTTLLNPFTKFGAALLFSSTVLAAVTYTSSREEIGISGEDITDRILETRFDYDLVEEALAEEYSTWISKNYRVNTQNALLFTLTLLTAVMAICYLFTGAVQIYRQPLPWYTNVFLVAVFLVVAKFSGLYGQVKRWNDLTNPRGRLGDWLRQCGWRVRHPVQTLRG